MLCCSVLCCAVFCTQARAATSRGVARAFFGSRADGGSSTSNGRPAFVAAGAPAASLHARGRRGASCAAAVSGTAAVVPAASRVRGLFNAQRSPVLSTRGGGSVSMMSTSG